MALGMTYEQYWYDSPYLIKSFEKAHDLRNQQKNQEMYVMGCYVFDAITTALSNVHFDGKNHPFNHYRKEPYKLNQSVVSQQESERQAQLEREKIIKSLTEWKKVWEKHSSQ